MPIPAISAINNYDKKKGFEDDDDYESDEEKLGLLKLKKETGKFKSNSFITLDDGDNEGFIEEKKVSKISNIKIKKEEPSSSFNNNTLSLNRQRRKDADSLPPAYQKNNGVDNSAPRRLHENSLSNKNRHRNHDGSLLKRRKHDGCNRSPSRHRHHSNHDNSPPRSRYCDVDNSPPRRRHHGDDDCLSLRYSYTQDDSLPHQNGYIASNRRKKEDDSCFNFKVKKEPLDDDLSPQRHDHRQLKQESLESTSKPEKSGF